MGVGLAVRSGFEIRSRRERREMHSSGALKAPLGFNPGWFDPMLRPPCASLGRNWLFVFPHEGPDA